MKIEIGRYSQMLFHLLDLDHSADVKRHALIKALFLVLLILLFLFTTSALSPELIV